VRCRTDAHLAEDLEAVRSMAGISRRSPRDCSVATGTNVEDCGNSRLEYDRCAFIYECSDCQGIPIGEPHASVGLCITYARGLRCTNRFVSGKVDAPELPPRGVDKPTYQTRALRRGHNSCPTCRGRMPESSQS
jgi:hypothetical protein